MIRSTTPQDSGEKPLSVLRNNRLWAVLVTAAGISACLLLTWLVYSPGLRGGFLLDDMAILPMLGERGGVRDLPSLLFYLTSQTGDPLGRPVAMLSFLLDATNWPADPAPFKRTGLLIHVANGVLLCGVLFLLGRRYGLEAARALAAALIGSLLWALHPLHASTVLYVAQRPTLLATTFLLIALICMDRGFSTSGRNSLTTAWIVGGVLCMAAMLLAVLSKGSGVLAPLLLLLVWLRFHYPQIRPADASFRKHRMKVAAVALITPSLVALGVLAWVAIGTLSEAEVQRDWSLTERMLTQPRALADYLRLLLFPSVVSRGLFADSFPLSLSLTEPATTLIALIALGSAVAYVIVRWKHGLLPLALAFFFVGHALESGFIDLEPYFEHRNYGPSLLLFWPLAVWSVDANKRFSPKARATAALAAIAILSVLTWQRASAWSSAELLAEVTERRYPESPRLQLFLSSAELRRGAYADATRRLETVLDAKPAQPLLSFNLLHAECANAAPKSASVARSIRSLREFGGWDRTVYQWLSDRIHQANHASCPHLQLAALRELSLALLENESVVRDPSAHQDALSLSGQLLLAEGNDDAALVALAQSLASMPSPDAALWLASIATSSGEHVMAASLLSASERCLPRNGVPVGIPRLRERLERIYPEHDPFRAELVRSIRAGAKPSEISVLTICNAIRGAQDSARAVSVRAI